VFTSIGCNDGDHVCWCRVTFCLSDSLAEHGLVRVAFLCYEREGSSVADVTDLHPKLLPKNRISCADMIAGFISCHGNYDTTSVQPVQIVPQSLSVRARYVRVEIVGLFYETGERVDE